MAFVIAAAMAVLVVGLDLSRGNRPNHQPPESAPSQTTTTYVIQASEPPRPLDGSDLPEGGASR
jgi:hypothetical protein